jgi:hypothetical protein
VATAMKRCAECKTLSHYTSDLTYGGYKYCPVCHPAGEYRSGPRDRIRLEQVPVTEATVEAALVVVRAAENMEHGLGTLAELNAALKLWREASQ